MAIVSNKRIVGSPNIHYYDEDNALAANAFQVGDLVKLNSDGELVIATSGAILGIALASATGVDNTAIPVDVIGTDEFSAVWTSEATSETLVNDIADFTFTTGAQVLTGGGSADAVVVDHDPKDEWGTTSGRVIVKLIPAAAQMGDATE